MPQCSILYQMALPQLKITRHARLKSEKQCNLGMQLSRAKINIFGKKFQTAEQP